METKDKNSNENDISEEDDLPSYNSHSIKEPSIDFEEEIIYPPPESFHDFEKDEEEIKNSKKNKDGKINDNIDISKKDSKDNNLNIDSMISNNQQKTIKDKFNDFSFNNNPTQVSYDNSSITNSSAISGISNSRERINKEENIKDIKVNIKEELLSSLKQAFPGLPSTNNYKAIYKYLKDENYFNLTIFEVMNIIQREAGIILTKNRYKNNESYAYNFPIEFLDIADPVYINKEHLFIMKTYKTMCIDDKNKNKYFEISELTQDFLYDERKNEQRRKVIKFLDGTYNYIPQLCKKEKCDNKDCIYSHNKNEINYHPLFYKTEFKDDTDYSESNMALCPTAKNYEEDFRIIYNNKDQNIINLMILLDQECNTEKRIKDFYKTNKIRNFNLNTFKIRKCKNHECSKDKDPHLCYFYHNLSERRRPPYLYRYTNERCEDFKLKSDKIIKNCKNGDFCYKAHTSNEYNYHMLHFGKSLICCRNIIDGKCEFMDTCYAYHDENDKNTKIKIIKEKLEKEIDKLKKEKNIDKFRCQKCDRIIRSLIYYYLKCPSKHILCKNCYNKIKSDKICPLCNEEFTVEKKIMFKPNDSSKKKDD